MTTSHTNQQKSNQFANRTTKSATSSYLISLPFLSQSESIHSPKRSFINLLSYTLSQSVKPSYSSLFSFFQHPLSLSSSYFSTSSRIPIFCNSRNPAYFARTFSFLWWRHCFTRVPLFAMNNAGANKLDSMLSYVSGRDGSQGPNLFDKGDFSWFVDDVSEVGSWLMMATELVPQTSNLDSTFPVDSGKPGPFSFGT